jgi:opacity protein-like surface antigen
MKKGLAVAGVAMLLATAAFAQKPAQNVSPAHHPNLAAAQRFARDAYEKVVAAQRANEWDMNGHAQKAKELLDQVSNEPKLAAESANQNKGK